MVGEDIPTALWVGDITCIGWREQTTHSTVAATSSYGRRRSSYSTVRGRYNATSLANGAFVNDKFTVRPSFTYTLAVYYSAGFKLLDFNNWIRSLRQRMGQRRNRWQDTGDSQCHVSRRVSASFGERNIFQRRLDGPVQSCCSYTFLCVWYRDNTGRHDGQTATFGYAVNHDLQCQILELPFVGRRVAMVIFRWKRKVWLRWRANSLSSPSRQPWPTQGNSNWR